MKKIIYPLLLAASLSGASALTADAEVIIKEKDGTITYFVNDYVDHVEFTDEAVSYVPVTDNTVEPNTGYILVSGNACAGPVSPASGYYGYMFPQDIRFNEANGSVALADTGNSFTFLNSIEIDGTTYNTPEGKFLLRQGDGKLLFLANPTYYNFGIQGDTNSCISDGQFKDSYLWAAEKQSDGLWLIYCDYVYNDKEMRKGIFYDDNYKNFANYTDDQLATHPGGVLLKLYKAENK